MFIRKVFQKNKDTGTEYCTFRLAETYRTADGKVRQRVLLNLGSNFVLPQEQWKLLADRIEQVISGQITLFPPEMEIEELAQNIARRVTHRVAKPDALSTTTSIEDFYTVDINSLEHQQVRQIGAEHAGYEIAKQLQLEEILAELKFNRKQINIALGSIIGRLIAPKSERATCRYLQMQSALDELLGCDFQQLSLDQLYRISDKLLANKKIIEEKLFQKEKHLFQLKDVITLYDLTNTYFEGRCVKNAKAKYGRSKEKRSDCPIVTLALVLDASGFPKKSEIYAGNIGEPKTLAEMLERLEGKTKPTVVLDAGIASEENLEWLKKHNYTYIVVSKKSKSTLPTTDDYILQHEKDYLIKAKLIRNEETQESELYCFSELKAKKEEAMRSQAEVRYEEELKKIAAGLNKKSTSKKYEKILERLGRLKEKYKQVGFTYEVKVSADAENKKVTSIVWEKHEEKQKQAGVYCLRSNREDLNEQTFWNIYIMLTELEAAFRCLKSELGLRPVYHQKTSRVDSHIFISILAYHILHTIRYKLKQNTINDSWERIRTDLQTHCRITTTVNCKSKNKLHIRKTSLANPRQLEIYRALNISSHPGKNEKSIF